MYSRLSNALCFVIAKLLSRFDIEEIHKDHRCRYTCNCSSTASRCTVVLNVILYTTFLLIKICTHLLFTAKRHLATRFTHLIPFKRFGRPFHLGSPNYPVLTGGVQEISSSASRRSRKGTHSHTNSIRENRFASDTPFFSSTKVLETHDQKVVKRTRNRQAEQSTTAEHHSESASRGRQRYPSRHLTTSFCARREASITSTMDIRYNATQHDILALFLRNTRDSNMISPHLTPQMITPDLLSNRTDYIHVASRVLGRLRQSETNIHILGLHATMQKGGAERKGPMSCHVCRLQLIFPAGFDVNAKIPAGVSRRATRHDMI
jgi:hypothetical protein